MAPASPPVAPAANPDPSEKLPAERVAEFMRDVLARSAVCAWPVVAKALQEGRAPRLTRRGKILYYLWRREQPKPIIDLRAVEIELANHPELFAALTASPAMQKGSSQATQPPTGADGRGVRDETSANAVANMGTGETKMASDNDNMATVAGKMDPDNGKMTATAAKSPSEVSASAMPESLSPTAFARWLGLDRRRVRGWLVEIPPGPVPPLPPGRIPARRFGNSLRILRIDFHGEPGVTPVPIFEVGGSSNGHHQETVAGSAGQGALHRSLAALRDRYRPRG